MSEDSHTLNVYIEEHRQLEHFDIPGSKLVYSFMFL